MVEYGSNIDLGIPLCEECVKPMEILDIFALWGGLELNLGIK